MHAPLPDPLNTPDCDLTGYDYMPLKGQKLFKSHFYVEIASQNPLAGLLGIKLWWEAWQQCPAGSLPSSDSALCRLADLGRDLRTWGRIKQAALHGFVLCNDGRLYHPYICQLARKALAVRVKERNRKANQRARGAEHLSVEQEQCEAQPSQLIENIENGVDLSAGQARDIPGTPRGTSRGRPAFVPPEGKVSKGKERED